MNVLEVVRLGLPPGARLVAGEAGAGRQVSWATTFRSRPPALDHLEGGELVLLSPGAVRVVDASLSVSRIITNLQQRGVSALAVAGTVERDAIQAADASVLPVIELAATADLHGLERSIIGLLVNKEAELESRANQIQRQLTQAAMQNRGLDGIVRELATLTGKSVAVRDTRLDVLAHAGEERWPGAGQRQAMQAMLQRPVSVTQEAAAEWIGGQRQADPCWAAVIAVNNRAGGLVTLAAAEEDLTELDQLVTSRAATVLAVELLKERAVVEAETKLQGDFVRDVLRGSYGNESAALARLAHLDWDVAARQGVLALNVGGAAEAGAAALRAAVGRRGIRPLVTVWEGEVACIYPLPDGTGPAQWRDAAELIRLEVGGEVSSRPVSCGIGRPNAGLRGLQRSFVEAEQALRAGERLFGPGQTVAFADLGAYRLLAHLQGTPELDAFQQETLGELADYDRKTGSHLMQTLEGFFTHNGNLSKTAEVLYVHRNTLMYRLNRIQELTGVSLDDAETRFDLQLALKMHRVAATRGR
ncbi:MAG: helix-turn-helix domain-containing protein [Chloroflexota bacterium]